MQTLVCDAAPGYDALSNTSREVTLQEKFIFGLFSVTLPLPGIIALLALLSRRRVAWRGAALSLSLFGAIYAICERRFLQRRMPPRGWLLLPIVALWLPLQILWTLLLNNEVEWRGQRLRLHKDGTVEILRSLDGTR